MIPYWWPVNLNVQDRNVGAMLAIALLTDWWPVNLDVLDRNVGAMLAIALLTMPHLSIEP
jgi:hypothetical protein